MNRTGALAVAVGLTGVALAVGVWRWPSSRPALDCPADQVHLDGQGVARCGPGQPLSAAQRLSLGLKLDLNRATADELALVPSVGPQLARALVAERERLGRFATWDQVDAVAGVGPARLSALQQATEIR